jgi:hypothetical protein
MLGKCSEKFDHMSQVSEYAYRARGSSSPHIDDILTDCAKGKIWSKMDMINSFFQTCMHPDNVHLTMVTTPFRLYEWLATPMGLQNLPAIHQCHVTSALWELLG